MKRGTKTVLFLPGFKDNLNSRNYEATINAIRDQGYEVTFVPITWWRTTFTDWAQEFDVIYQQYDPDRTILAGFSYGAMIALEAASIRPPQSLWLFSLSPYFAEDIPKIPVSWLRSIGHRRVSAFSKLSFDNLAAKITCPTLLFYGEEESPAVRSRAENSHELIKNSQLVVVPGVKHDVSNPAYIKAIIGQIKI